MYVAAGKLCVVAFKGTENLAFAAMQAVLAGFPACEGTEFSGETMKSHLTPTWLHFRVPCIFVCLEKWRNDASSPAFCIISAQNDMGLRKMINFAP
ncbi:MAG: hypothetical protein IJ692_01125 [Alloprevotella sp.]|nr:hypothetical protein [Alloprevotella sp.]